MSLEALNKRIKTTTDLRDIVSTMKMLSSVSIGPYEKALISLNEYSKTVKTAFIGLMKDDRFYYTPQQLKSNSPKTIAIVIGTDNGLVGRFNRDVITYARKDLSENSLDKEVTFICIGKRLGLLADSAKVKVAATYPIMNSLKEITTISSMVLMKINELIHAERTEQVFIYYTIKKTGESQRVEKVQLMPLPQQDMISFKKEKWTGRTLPLIADDKGSLFTALIHEYLTVVLSGSLTSSLAAEHYTRMVNMQQAEKNIDESLETMNMDYQQIRQTSITDELIDIVSGAESLKKKKST